MIHADLILMVLRRLVLGIAISKHDTDCNLLKIDFINMKYPYFIYDCLLHLNTDDRSERASWAELGQAQYKIG